MSSPDDAVSLLDRARAARDSLDARLLLAAAVTRVALEVGARAIVTGGTAVDFYAAGATGTSEGLPVKWETSGDIDVVVVAVPGSNAVRADVLHALEDRLGLRPSWFLKDVARVIDVPDYPYGLEIVASELRGDPTGARVFTALVDGVHPVHFRGPEDVILSYAESGWHMRHDRDWERALATYAAMKDRLDMRWMVEEAARRGYGDALEAVMKQRPSPWKPARRSR